MNVYVKTLALWLLSFTTIAAEWSNTEIHLQKGELDVPSFAGQGSADSTIVTLQHASGWQYGSHFFFVDFIRDDENDGFNDTVSYMEYYGAFSLGKIFDKKLAFGPVSDVGLVAGFNLSPDAKVRKYLPGVRLSWDIPGFAYFNSDITAFIDDSDGVAAGGAPSTDNSYMLDVSFLLPWQWGEKNRFSLTGHVEYIASREDEFGNDVSSWILAQPQLRYDLSHRLWGQQDQLFVGIEYQYWRNKLGDEDTDESSPLLLVVWRL